MVAIVIKALQIIFSLLGPLFPGFTAKLARRVWFTTLRIQKSHTEQKIADLAKASIVNIQGIPIRLWQWGEEGPTILFIHGWSGRGTQIVSFVKLLVDQGFQVLSFDAPAHGESGGKHTDIFNTVETLSEIVKLKGPVYGVITHSMGGIILAQLMNGPINAERIVLICPPVNLDAMLRNFQRRFKLTERITEKLRTMIKEEMGENIEEKLSLLNKTNRFNCPVLIVHDEDDLEVDWHSSESLAKQISQAEFYKTQRLGHIKILFDQTVIRKVGSFFR